MSLLKLPNELLILILECILPADIENFSKICSRVRELSGPMVREHRILALEYSHIQVFKEIVPSTLTDYCTGSYRLSQYPRSLDIMGWDKYSPFNRIPSGTLDRLLAMAKRIGLIADDRVHHWFGEISSRDMAIIPFLLPCLPNLQTLRFIGPKCEGLEYVEEIVNSVVESQRRSKNLQALSKLSSLIISNYEERETTKLGYFLPFMQLHSLRIVFSALVDCRDLKQLQFPSRSSLVERLRLTKSIVPGKTFKILFRGFKALKFLQYSPFVAGDFDPRAMRYALLEHQRHTLQVLNVTSQGRPHAPMGSLRGFTALKVVKLNPELLGTGTETSRLVRFFPPSIESIEIIGAFVGLAELQFFHCFSRLRQPCVPNLKTVDAHDYLNRWPTEILELEGDFQFEYRNICHNDRKWASQAMSWYGVTALGEWARFGNGLNVYLFSDE